MANFSEFGHGRGQLPPQSAGYVPTPLDRHLARMKTDPANPNASEEDVLMPGATHSRLSDDGLEQYIPGTLASGKTPMVVETSAPPRVGQHKKIDPSLPKGGDPDHQADGEQDGSGAAWRASVPPNPVL